MKIYSVADDIWRRCMRLLWKLKLFRLDCFLSVVVRDPHPWKTSSTRQKHYPDSIIFTSSWPLTGSRWRLFSLDDRVMRDAFKRPRDSEKGSSLEKWSIYCYNVDWVKSVKCWKLYRDEIREMSLKRQISLSICAFVHFITALKTA